MQAGFDEGAVSEDKESLDHDGNKSLSAAAAGSSPRGSGSSATEIESTASATEVTISGSARAESTQGTEGDQFTVSFVGGYVRLSTVVTTAGRWSYSGTLTAAATTSGACVRGTLRANVYRASGTSSGPEPARSNCSGGSEGTIGGTESFGGGMYDFWDLKPGDEMRVSVELGNQITHGTGSVTFDYDAHRIASPVTNTAAPTISGVPEVGKTLTAGPGTWTGEPTSYGYQWLNDGSPVAGATSPTYVVRSADVDHGVSVRVTATNGTTSATSTSAAVAGRAAALRNTRKPVAKGTPRVGKTLTADAGAWTPAPTGTTYQWLRNGAAVRGATKRTFRLTRADQGKKVAVRVTVSRAGSTSAAATSAARKVTKS